MLRTKVDAQQSLWEAILPPEFSRLPPGLEQVDRLLDDPVFFEPFKPFFDPKIGRPSIRMETYLRMMFLRFRYRSASRPCVLRSLTPSPAALLSHRDR